MQNIDEENLYGIIYKVTNLINHKVYIGQTTIGFENRKRQHCGDIGNIVKVCNGVYKQHKGFIWVYKENYKSKI